MKKPMAKKAMPAKKGAAKMAAKPAMPMMKKGGMAKKYEMGGASGPPRSKPFYHLQNLTNGKDWEFKGTGTYGLMSKNMGVLGGESIKRPAEMRFDKPAPRPAPEKPSMPKMNRKNSPLKDGTYRKGGKAMMRKGGKSC